MVETVNYQCPACGGPLRFAGDTAMLKCDYCDSQFSVEQVEALYAGKQDKAETKAEKEASKSGKQGDTVVATGKAQAEKAKAQKMDPIQAYLQRASWEDAESEHLCSSVCSSCGAELIHDQTTAVTQCPYCGNNTVIPGTMAGTLKPDYVIPFKLGKEHAIEALKRYYKGKKFLPSAFANDNHIEEVQGVYVPFWLYSARSDAEARFSAQNVRSWREGKYEVTETDFFDVERAGYMDYTRVPVDGSQKMPDSHMDAIEPFDYGELKPFSVAYLPGFLTDRFDMTVEDCKPRALGRIGNSSEQALESTVQGYSLVESQGCNVDTKVTDVSYALFPVWMLHTKWSGQDFLFAMNGQTGKFIGDLPIQKSKVVKWFLGISVPLAAIATTVVYFLM